MQRVKRRIACPTCGDDVTTPVPDEDVEPKPRPYRAAYGEYTTLECSNDHTVWVYFC
ncbi:hypothetical protein [Natrarchaeobaculum aegyptiacum]|uniref:hypothetical protein n=1 Tax=Natrarchaeobaculum aegyptiacum TaxID=745377 RepID=UPI0016432D0F|nr:hypothetical protein [Natrarchaeobaculum aegyptiacum]